MKQYTCALCGKTTAKTRVVILDSIPLCKPCRRDIFRHPENPRYSEFFDVQLKSRARKKKP